MKTVPKAWPEEETGYRLVVAVRKNKRWATWGLPERAYSFLCHPSVVDFSGQARFWASAVPEKRAVAAGSFPTQPVFMGTTPEGLAPGDSGLYVVDYDRKVCHAFIEEGGRNPLEFHLVEWGLRTRKSSSLERTWVPPLLRAGFLKQAHWPDGLVTPVPTDLGGDHGWLVHELEKALRKSRGWSALPENGNPLETLVRLPLSIPGWELNAWYSETPSHPTEGVLKGFSRLVEDYGLSETDRQRWADWSTRFEVAELTALLRSAVLESSLSEVPVRRAPRM